MKIRQGVYDTYLNINHVRYVSIEEGSASGCIRMVDGDYYIASLEECLKVARVLEILSLSNPVMIVDNPRGG